MAGTRNYQRRNFAQFEPTALNEHLVLPLAFQKKADDTRLTLANRVNELAQQQVRGADIAVRDQMIKGFQDEIAGTLDSYNGDVARASKEIIPMIGAARNNPAWNEMLRLNKDKEEFDKFKRNAEASGKVVHDLGLADSTPLMNEDGTLNNVQYQPKVFEGSYRDFMEKYVDDIKPDGKLTKNLGKINEALRMTGPMGDVHTRQERINYITETLGVDLANEYDRLTGSYTKSAKGREQIERYTIEGMTEEQAKVQVESEMLEAIKEREFMTTSNKDEAEGFNMSTSGLPASFIKDYGGGKTEQDGFSNNTVLPVNDYIRTDVKDWWGNTNVLVSGVVNTKNFEMTPISTKDQPVNIGIGGWGDGETYVFRQEDNYLGTKGAKQRSNVTLYGANKVGNSVIPVSTGVVYNSKGEPLSKDRLDDIDHKKGMMIVESDSDEKPNILEVAASPQADQVQPDGSVLQSPNLNKIVNGTFDGTVIGGMIPLEPGKYIAVEQGGEQVYLKVEDKVFDAIQGKESADDDAPLVTVYQETSNNEAAYLTGKSNENLATIKYENGENGMATVHMNETSSKSGEIAQGIKRNITEKLTNMKYQGGDPIEIARLETALKGSDIFIQNHKNNNYNVQGSSANSLSVFLRIMQSGVNQVWEDQNIQDKKPTGHGLVNSRQ